VHNPAFLIPLVEKNGNLATFAVIHAIFENSGKNSGISKSRYFYGPLIPLIHSRSWISLVITYKISPLKKKEENMRKLEILDKLIRTSNQMLLSTTTSFNDY